MIRTKPVTGEGEGAAWFRTLLAKVNSQRLLSGSNYRVKQYSYGTALEFYPSGGGSTAAKLGVQLVFFQGINDPEPGGSSTTLSCIDGGGNSVLVLKPVKLRHNIPFESIENVQINYTYQSRPNNLDGQRTATDPNGYQQIEIILPLYLQGDPIYALTVPGGSSGSQVLDLNIDARAWCQIG